ncbi:MAG: hypothetical protein ACHQ7N_22210 [Candidatus Methylomirabilales bacterium]
MSVLTVVLVLAMLLWAMGFVVSGLVLAEEVLSPPKRRGLASHLADAEGRGDAPARDRGASWW